MTGRITFRGEVFIDGENYNDIMSKFENLNLFSDEARKCGADFVEVDEVTNDDTGEELTEDYFDPENPICPYCDGDYVMVESEPRNDNECTLYKCLECGNEFSR